MPGVDFVHRGEVLHADEIDIRLDHVVEALARRLQNLLDVGDDFLGLAGGAAGYKLFRRHVVADLARKIEEVPRPDGGGKGKASRRGEVHRYPWHEQVSVY